MHLNAHYVVSRLPVPVEPDRRSVNALATGIAIFTSFSVGAEALGTHFQAPTCVDHLAGDGKHTIATEMKEVLVQGLQHVQVRDEKGDLSEAILEIKYRRIRVLPPLGKHKQYPELLLTIMHAQERGIPQGREKIDWKLITKPVRNWSGIACAGRLRPITKS
jgi:hypothetical protein